jgi:lipid-binding SYLF domain-containing protein
VADVQKGADKRIHNAAESFREIMKVPEKGIPRDLFDKAQCVVIIPNLIKGAFVVGGKYGRGFASCRKKGDGWSAPAGVRIEGGSFGLQIGGSSTDILMLVMNQSGMNRLLSDKFTIGGSRGSGRSRGSRNKREHGHPAACRDPILVPFPRAVRGSFARGRYAASGHGSERKALR